MQYIKNIRIHTRSIMTKFDLGGDSNIDFNALPDIFDTYIPMVKYTPMVFI